MVVAHKSLPEITNTAVRELCKKKIYGIKKEHKEDEWENEDTSIIQSLVKEYFIEFIYVKVIKQHRVRALENSQLPDPPPSPIITADRVKH